MLGMSLLKQWDGTDPEARTRNNSKGVGLVAEPLLTGHKGSSCQTRAAAIGKQKHKRRIKNDERQEDRKEYKQMSELSMNIKNW